ncbi:MAG TPA: carboxypeptidase-like regulatory domain-containing protein [Puia sp.]|nr:carboxypeptidase-like regulatory domain-containing protein [Puia sp.]
MSPLKKPLPTLVLLAFAALILIGISCNKDASPSNSTNTNPNNIPAEVTVTASLQGRVVDGNGLPIQGAAVTSGTARATTDINGIFSFSNISMSSRFGYVKAAKDGYFTGSKSIMTNGGSSNFVSIQLVAKTATNSFPAPTGGVIVVPSQGVISAPTADTISFSDSAVVTADGSTEYTGTVDVYAIALDATDSLLYNSIPGDLRGIGSNGQETGLQSFGILDVELGDGAGNALQLATGKSATVTWGIPASLQSVAPATVPLWYFNDTTGRWVQQGSAVRSGNSYVGQISHSSWWTCAQPMTTVNFNVTFKDQYGNPLAYAYYSFEARNTGTRGGYTNAAGFAQGLVPKGESLTLKIVSQCGTLLGGVNIGPALGDQALGTVTVNTIGGLLTLTGTVVNCSNAPVDSGSVSANVDGLTYKASVKNGEFTMAVNRCYSTQITVGLTPEDLTTQITGNATSVNVSVGKVSVGQLTACQ